MPSSSGFRRACSALRSSSHLPGSRIPRAVGDPGFNAASHLSLLRHPLGALRALPRARKDRSCGPDRRRPREASRTGSASPAVAPCRSHPPARTRRPSPSCFARTRPGWSTGSPRSARRCPQAGEGREGASSAEDSPTLSALRSRSRSSSAPEDQLLTAVDTEVSLPSSSGGMRRFVAWFRTKARIDDATAVGTVPYRRIGAIVVQVGT